MPKISLILPLYNAEKYLKPCLDSVKQQTFSDFECLCVDDGCSDNTSEILADYAKDDARFVIIKQENAGCSEARNTGIKNAKAPYLMFLDQDDFFHPQAMEALYNLIETHKTDIAAFTFQNVDDDFDISSVPEYDINAFNVEKTNTPFNEFLMDTSKRSVVVWTRIYNKKAIEGLYFPKNVQPAEDSTFTLKVFHRIKSMVTIKEPLLFYRDGNDTSVMAEQITNRYVNAHIGAARAIDAYFKDNEITAEQRISIKEYVANLVYKTCISQVIRWTPTKEDRINYINLSLPQVKKLVEEGVFDMSYLKFRRRVAAKLFIHGYYTLSKIFL